MKTNIIIQGDVIEELKKLPDNSIDAIITDPPYELGFMGKKWDYSGISFNINLWKECLRVLKYGGHLLSFGGTRTYHRLTCSIEDAGFEIRDCIMWIYGSGFPKNLNVGKQVDKIQGNKRESKGIVKGMGTRPNILEFADRPIKNKFELTEGNSEWEGWGTALKPACEPIVVARKPLSERNVALNVLKWGTGGINIDACRIGTDDKLGGGANTTGSTPKHEGYRRPWMDDKEHIKEYIERKKDAVKKAEEQGRFPANIILECTCDNIIKGKKKPQKQGCVRTSKDEVYDLGFKKKEGYVANAPDDYGDSGDIHTDPNCPCYLLDEQSGKTLSKGGQSYSKTSKIYGEYSNDRIVKGCGFGDKGGASRFFYCAKANKGERNLGCENFEPKLRADANKIMGDAGKFKTGSGNPRNSLLKNNHPTVKPIKLMEYLVKLITRENAIVLDPFLGSGTTAIACVKTGRKYIGMEKEKEYIKIAKARIKQFSIQKKLK